ncbi:MAG: NADH-quinone oxidoreductase subunit F [Zetaproteobacteria bacterium CG12_big_fil_rev_8_21_14_0_65_55_1124]|nr:MAG: NADH oxidoreductase (quinone) subunit F [Zetaproteobacteria bacterium CG1_02_55_237]PIS19281.1 MAG: NADH-quinone oxidoreductase subunit F [Zetaproteobacteria bacterium CG08_land_8_20_14_0_20_55_17]PIW43542.1 MAG: NADH-quinone oxidoreductase subunit F [Zetaproteobacteria bacterium CG12_big_fil_rev_8_21_14_0_65_55_1124]PIY54404.1 MAG: NADH-quinone oxidoreductase subunit F [Zetaproteobacteria bacterium CG_4_10_14_0_8_um_filter_55_43]PIZ39005.1 MAG: NADH-quinone oxidoreductase subunit F [Ze
MTISADPKKVKAICFDRVEIKGQNKLAVAKANGAYEFLPTVLKEFTSEKIIAEVKTSGLRGRGGAGFPTGLKWSFVPRNTGKPIYLLCNADEGEPGTFKDRDIMRFDPHLLIEGMIMAGFALGVHDAYIYIRGEFLHEANVLNAAIDEAYAANLLGEHILGSDFSMNLTVHRGAGAYICGEETALIESLEGKPGRPRFKPPFPAVEGYYGCPTVVNNVETLATIPAILKFGGAWHAAIGKPNSTGMKIFSVSGHVNKPGNYEVPMGTSLKTLIEEYCGGLQHGTVPKVIIPGGSSTPWLTAEHYDTPLTYDDMVKAGSFIGSGAIIVMDETADLLALTRRLSHFYAHESCGQCTPCREGAGWLERVLTRIEAGQGQEGDMEVLQDAAQYMAGRTICALAEGAAAPVLSIIRHFPEAVKAGIVGKAA